MRAGPLRGEELEGLRSAALEAGFARFGVVRVNHPAFEAAAAELDRYLDEGFAGEMAFMERTREVRKSPSGLLEGARTVLVGLVPYRGEQGPVARYAQWADYHTQLHRRLEGVVAWLEDRRPGVRTLICVDSKPLGERTAAAAAGLGFLGKSGCLIARGLGTYVLIGAIVCDLDVEGVSGSSSPEPSNSDRPPWDACGSCRACLDACPTQAFVAPGRLDPRRCISYLTIEHRGFISEALAAGMGERVAGCDVCQEVCPYNASDSIETRVPPQAWLPAPPGRSRDADLPRLANIGNNQHKGFVKHTALNRIPRPALRRNAIIALGNGEGPLSASAREALTDAREDADPELAKWAAWALARRDGARG